uniref:BTB domain-containing protein n=1 Tax=Lygus hesperus TaxID=30085 RepID=A0A0K8TC02_LYGHE
MMMEVDCFAAMHTRLHSFMKAGMYTDVNFVIGTCTIKAHKAVVASCSQVFQTMFDTSMNEAHTSEVVITDVDEKAFSVFLDYIYIRDVGIVKNYVRELLMLADKYDIEPLALVCDNVIQCSLTAENAVESLLLANLHRRDRLKNQITLFIKGHLNDVSATANWAKLDDNFKVMNGIFQSFLPGNVGASNSELDKVRWTFQNKNWIEPAHPSPLIVDGYSDVVLLVKPTKGPTGHDKLPILIHVEYENKLKKLFPLYLKIVTYAGKWNTLISISTCNLMPLFPNSKGSFQVFITCIPNVTPYQMNIEVSAKKAEPITQHPLLKTVKDYKHRFADAVVVVANVRFPVHKLVLAERSAFFSNIFDKTQNEYRIDGMAENTFKTLLNYMYSNCLPEKVDLPLLKGAEQFQLNELSRFCFSTLQKSITFDNAIEMVTKAEELQLDKFSTEVIEFMAKEPNIVAKSPKWPKMRNHANVLKKLLYRMKK